MTHVEHTRTFPVPVATAWDVVAPVHLPDVLGRRYLAIPGVVRVDQEQAWPGHVGQRRTLHFSDGGRTTEVLTELDPPAAFGYELAEVHGPMKALVAGVDGRWVFRSERDGQATRLTWSWEIRPTLAGRALMPVLVVVWRGMARRCFDRIGELLRPSS